MEYRWFIWPASLQFYLVVDPNSIFLYRCCVFSLVYVLNWILITAIHLFDLIPYLVYHRFHGLSCIYLFSQITSKQIILL